MTNATRCSEATKRRVPKRAGSSFVVETKRAALEAQREQPSALERLIRHRLAAVVGRFYDQGVMLRAIRKNLYAASAHVILGDYLAAMNLVSLTHAAKFIAIVRQLLRAQTMLGGHGHPYARTALAGARPVPDSPAIEKGRRTCFRQAMLPPEATRVTGRAVHATQGRAQVGALLAQGGRARMDRPPTSETAPPDVGGCRGGTSSRRTPLRAGLGCIAAACGVMLATGCEAPIDLGFARHCADGMALCAVVDGGVECVDLRVDPSNCGACGQGCADGVATLAACVLGICGGRCAADRAECDGDPANGCETDIARDRFHCGGCGSRCEAGAGCAAGRCVLRNLGLGRPAQQSSTYVPGGVDRGPGLAVDGRLCQVAARYGGEDGSPFSCPVSYTTAVAESWWQVDLGESQLVARVDIWQPLDFAVRLEGSDDGEAWREFGSAAPQLVPPLRIAVESSMRWVRVVRPSAESLMLSEVEVWGR